MSSSKMPVLKASWANSGTSYVHPSKSESKSHSKCSSDEASLDSISDSDRETNAVTGALVVPKHNNIEKDSDKRRRRRRHREDKRKKSCRKKRPSSKDDESYKKRKSRKRRREKELTAGYSSNEDDLELMEAFRKEELTKSTRNDKAQKQEPRTMENVFTGIQQHQELLLQSKGTPLLEFGKPVEVECLLAIEAAPGQQNEPFLDVAKTLQSMFSSAHPCKDHELQLWCELKQCDTDEIAIILVKRQQVLNEKVREHPSDIQSWKQLALLSHKTTEVHLKHKRKQESSERERSISILKAAIEANPLDTSLRIHYIQNLVDKGEPLVGLIQNELDPIIYSVEHRATASHDEFGREFLCESRTEALQSLLQLYRQKVKCWTRNSSDFDAYGVRDIFIHGLASLYHIAESASLETTPNEIILFFSDMLQMESIMGHTERVTKLVQALLETHVRPRTVEDFRRFWSSGASRIGESFPQVKYNKKLSKSDHQRRRRPRASDFFDLSENEDSEHEGQCDKSAKSESREKSEEYLTDQFRFEHLPESKFNVLQDSYHLGCGNSQKKLKESHLVNHKLFSLTKFLSESLINKSLKIVQDEEVSRKAREEEDRQLELFDEKGSPTHDDVNQFLIGSQGNIVPSGVKSGTTKNIATELYSFELHRRIKVSKEELSADFMKDAMQRALKALRQKKKGKVDALSELAIKRSTSTQKLYAVETNDAFYKFGVSELHQQCLSFAIPQHIATDLDSYDDLLNMILPYFALGRSKSINHLVILVSLSFFGVWFPRSRFEQAAGLGANGGNMFLNLLKNEIYEDVYRISKGQLLTPPILWTRIFDLALMDQEICFIDRSLFEPANRQQAQFIRALLYDLVTNQALAGSPFASYLVAALMYLEVGLNEKQKGRTISLNILRSVSNESDPRCLMHFVRAQQIHQETPHELVDMIEASLCSQGQFCSVDNQRSGWTELVIMAVRLLCNVPLSVPFEGINERISVYLSPSTSQRNRAMHLLCCHVKDKFVPYQNQREEFASREWEKLKALLEEKISLQIKEPQKSRIPQHDECFFDCTEPRFFDVAVVTWFAILNSSSLNFSEGVNTLDIWIDLAVEQRDSVFLARLINLQLEYAVFDKILSHGSEMSPFKLAKRILIPAVASFAKIGTSVPLTIRYTLVAAESLILKSHKQTSYYEFLWYKRDPTTTDCMLLLKSIIERQSLSSTNDSIDENLSSPLEFLEAKLVDLNEVLRKLERENLSSASELQIFPIIYKAIVALRSDNPLKAIMLAKREIERANKPHIKLLWTMPFLVLRSVYNVAELSSHLIAMAETGIHLEDERQETA